MKVWNDLRRSHEILDSDTALFLRNGGTIKRGIGNNRIQEMRLVDTKPEPSLVRYGEPYLDVAKKIKNTKGNTKMASAMKSAAEQTAA